MDESRKPCGEYHPLPCGLDVDCPVPLEYFNASYNSNEIWTTYRLGLWTPDDVPEEPSLWCGQHGRWEPTTGACDDAYDPDDVEWLVPVDSSTERGV